MTKLLNPNLAVNWNAVEEPIDLDIWNRSTSNFWLPEKIALSNDLGTWQMISDKERLLTMRVFTGLTLLDTMQSNAGVVSMIEDSRTLHEESVLAYFAGMEAIHAKSYSSIFSTLSNSRDIDEAFKWSEENEYLQEKAAIVMRHYKGDNAMQKKIVSVLLESFLFYSGFWLPFHFSARGKLTNSADIIRLILRDEVIHGYYIGQKFQYAYNEMNVYDQEEIFMYTIEILGELFNNEVLYAGSLYDELGWTDQVIPWMKLNANRALSNLGFGPMFPKEECNVSPEILANLDPSANETHDFFSGSGSSYVIGATEETTDEDWGFDD